MLSLASNKFEKKLMNPIAKNIEPILTILDDIQAIDINVLDVHEQTSITDYMIICSGRSSRQVRAIAEQLMEKMKAQGQPSLLHNGLDSGEWALIDFGDAIVHVMQPESRAHYDLETLWSERKQ